MAHEQFEEAVPLYAMGALESPERLALEAHLLTGCKVCRMALKQGADGRVAQTGLIAD